MNDKYLNFFVSSGSLSVDVTWEIGLSWLWYELVKATNHQYDKAISKAMLHWVCLNCPFHCSSFTYFSFFFVFWRILQGLWLCQICDMIEKGTDHQWDKVMSSCFLFIYFCIQGFISLKLWATISHAFALVKCENLFLVQTGVTSLLIARRDTLKVRREKDLCRC